MIYQNLFEQSFQNITQPECSAVIYTVVKCLLGMQQAHAPFAITGDERTFNGPFGLSCRPCADTSFERRRSEAYFHTCSFLLIVMFTVVVIIIVVVATTGWLVAICLAFLGCKV